MGSVDGGPSGGSSVRRPGSEDPHRRQRKLFLVRPKVVYTRVFMTLGQPLLVEFKQDKKTRLLFIILFYLVRL